MPSIRPLYQDPFIPLLLSDDSVPVEVSAEKQLYIKKVLDKSSSDSRFADKAFVSIMSILGHGKTARPELTSLSPDNAKIGDPTFTLHVHGKNFGEGSTIIFAGQDEPTTIVSDTEVTTGVNMDTWFGADVLPVHVRNKDGVLSDPLMFTFNDAVSGTTSSKVMEAKKQTFIDATKMEKTAMAPEVGDSVSTSEKPSVDIKTQTEKDKEKK